MLNLEEMCRGYDYIARSSFTDFTIFPRDISHAIKNRKSSRCSPPIKVRPVGLPQRPFIMNRLANFLYDLFVLLCLTLAVFFKDPHLLPMRPYETPMLILVALICLIFTLQRVRTNTWLQAPFLLAWLAVLGIVSYKEYEFRNQKQNVLSATADHAKRLSAIGEHLIVGYDKVENIRELARRGFIAGLFVTRRNTEGKNFEDLRTELADLQILRRQAKLPPLIIAGDQEGGAVSKLSPPLPSQPALATLLTLGLSDAQVESRATKYGVEQAKALAALGININFSPVIDLKPTNASEALDFHTRIAERAIASDARTVAKVALAYSHGLLTQGVLPTVKHFPGLGSVTEDTHHFSARLKLSQDELNERDWYPFRQILSLSPALLMVGHVIVDAVDTELPASLSRKVITGIVRQNWKHNGVLISDDMTMAAVYKLGLCQSSIRSLNAGMDLLLLAYDWEKVYPTLDCLQSAQKSGQLIELEASRLRLTRLSTITN